MHRNDRLWNLAALLESSMTEASELQLHAVTCGALESVGHLIDPGTITLSQAHQQGLDFFLKYFDDETGNELTPYFNAGFIGLLVSADVAMKELGTMDRGGK